MSQPSKVSAVSCAGSERWACLVESPFLLFGVALFVPVVSGWTPLPRWACVFNILPLMLVLMPTRVGGSGNWAGAIMFLGLIFLL